jgi:8-oxo-dGTP pyrophosphatase MutT (NUDIX family)
MHPMLAQLEGHPSADAREASDLATICAFVRARADPFARSHLDAHLTGSAFVVSSDGQRVLLVHHRRLDLWLQPGGHGEPGERLGEEVALREAREETGIATLALHPTAPRPLDVDVHRIPERKGVPAHDHLDLRYLVVAPPGVRIRHDLDEAHDARWFTWEDLDAMPTDHPFRRMAAKARALVVARQPTNWPFPIHFRT